MPNSLPTILQNRQRIVIKIGSSLLVKGSKLRTRWLNTLCHDIAMLVHAGTQVVVVSSGSIALGSCVIEPHYALDHSRKKWPLEIKQAAAAAGQITLAQGWSLALKRSNLNAAQILLTLQDTESRRRHLNARATIISLLKASIIPVINENDTIATSEIRYGDNDRLAARVATMISADLFILLSDIDGLYTADPTKVPSAQHLSSVKNITFEHMTMAKNSNSKIGTGGMITKLDAARIASAGGCTTIIANGHHVPICTSLQNKRFSLFEPSTTPLQARKQWIYGSLNTTGTLYLDDGAIQAVRAGKSLLSAGVQTSDGTFKKGDHVILADATNQQRFAVGIINYSSNETKKITRCQSHQIETILGYSGPSTLVHRDNLVLDEATTIV